MDVGASSRAAPLGLSLQHMSHVLVGAAVASLVATATVLWGRRLVGAFEQPIAPSVVLSGCVVLISLGIVLRLPLIWSTDNRPAWAAPLALYGTSTALLIVAALLTAPNRQPWWSWLLLWAGVLTAEAIIYWRTSHSLTTNHAAKPSVRPVAVIDEFELPERVMQRFERSHDDELGEIISGQVRARFSAGQRVENVHLSFCPPFAQIPEVAAESVSGPNAKVKPSLVVPNGARIDIRLDRPAVAETDVIVEVFVQSSDRISE
jgi:hypothetical protein